MYAAYGSKHRQSIDSKMTEAAKKKNQSSKGPGREGGLKREAERQAERWPLR